MSETPRWPSLVIISIFVAAIFLPMSVQFLQADKDISVSEKRTLAKRPVFPRSLDETKVFPNCFELYANDQFGLRSFFLRLHSRVKWALGMEITKQVIVGKDGWLFLNERDNALAQYRGLYNFTHAELMDLLKAMAARKAWLDQKGIPFIMVIPPDKHTVYPEYLPHGLGLKVEESPMDQLTCYLSLNPDFPLVDLRPIVQEAKQRDQVFYRTDSHWNEMGGFAGYRELMKHVNQLLPLAEPEDPRDYCLQDETIKGDLTYMLYLDGVISERTKVMVLKRPTRVKRTVDLWQGTNGQVGMKTFYTNRPELPSALIFCDSFIWGMSRFLSETFDRTILVQHQGFNFYSDIVEREKPDIVIYEMVERLLKMKIGKIL
jgi:alginate O-acetyltransferase complex protein AlgJ